jgi:hypothetical protein
MMMFPLRFQTSLNFQLYTIFLPMQKLTYNLMLSSIQLLRRGQIVFIQLKILNSC